MVNLAEDKLLEDGAGRVEHTTGAGENQGNQTSGDNFGLGDIYNFGNDATYEKIGGRIIGLTSYICYAAAIIILAVKGVGFMKKAPEAKAEAKKELVSYAVGAFILFSAGAIIRLIGEIALNNLFQ